MKSFLTRTTAIAAFCAAAACAGPEAACSQTAARAGAGPNSSEIESRTRGLIHEGFDQPIADDPTPGLIVPEAPPALLGEQPPAARPSGAHVLWLPGYWSWDDGRQEFVWIRGAWRVPPPGERWIPGYWAKTEGGFQRTPGFWAAASEQQIRYCSTPPKSEETGPETPPPSPNHFYLPGYWIARGDAFAWQAGYWAQAKPGWVWTPAHYSWTPAGAVFVSGYWDYPLARRGQLFAPDAADQAVRRDQLSQSKESPLPLVGVDASARNRAALFAKHLHDIAVLRQQTETTSTAAGGGKSAPAKSLRLPKLPAALAGGVGAAGSSTAAAVDSLPGIDGRRVPGASGRGLPGLGGRVVPGVRDPLPGVELQKSDE